MLYFSSFIVGGRGRDITCVNCLEKEKLNPLPPLVKVRLEKNERKRNAKVEFRFPE